MGRPNLLAMILIEKFALRQRRSIAKANAMPERGSTSAC